MSFSFTVLGLPLTVRMAVMRSLWFQTPILAALMPATGVAALIFSVVVSMIV